MLVETFLRTYRRINMNWQRTGVALVALFAAAASYAYSAIVSISELTAKSRLVVLARVISIRESRTALGPEKRATAKVLEAWKGAPADHIDYVASPVGWFACDTSYSRVGETTVLFLERDKGSHGYRIAHFGRGRMPVVAVGNQSHAAVYEVTFPTGIVVRQQQYPFLFTVPVEKLKTIVRTPPSTRRLTSR